MNDSPKTFCVGVDGSEIAHLAFQTALRLRKKEDDMNVFHIADTTKTYLPYDLEPDYIKDNYETLLIANVPADHRVVRIREKRQGQSTKGASCEYVNNSEKKVDFFVVGCAGRKGPKQDPTILGTTTDYSLRAAHCSSIICKRRAEPTDGAATSKFLVCVDESPNSEKAFDEATKLAKDTDELIVFHIFEDEVSDGTQTTAEEVQASTRRRGPRTFASFKKSGGKPLGFTFASTHGTRGVDFIVVGADGMTAYRNGRSQLGSVSDYVVKSSKCDVVVTEVLTGS